MLLHSSFCDITRTHQTRRHPRVSAAEPGPAAEVLTQRETTHAVGTLCEETHSENAGYDQWTWT